MKSILLTALAVVYLVVPAQAENFDQNIVAIFGSGNPNTGWTTDVNSETGIVLALRAKNRENASTANVAGTYAEPVGLQQPNNNRARWNWEFSIDSGAVMLDQYDYYIGVDTDPSVGISLQIVDALSSFADNSYGTSSTLNGQGVEGTAAALAGSNTVVQQSQNILFWGQNATINATYDYTLYAVAKGAGYDGDKIASTSITVVVGSGGASVNDLIAALAAQATNHGDYVSAVSELTRYLLEGGVIDNKTRKLLINAAAKSSVGK